MVETNNTNPWGPTLNVGHEEEPPAYTAPPSHPPTSPADTHQTWSCPQCTLLNPVTARTCEACNYISAARITMITPPSPPIVATSTSTHRMTDHAGALNNVEEPLAKKRRRRCRRKVRMAAGAGTGLIVGAIVFCGPWGTVFGAAAGAGIARYLSKRGERKKDLRTFYATTGGRGQPQQGQGEGQGEGQEQPLLDPNERGERNELPDVDVTVH